MSRPTARSKTSSARAPGRADTKPFDRKFGADLIAGLPRSPAVYLFTDREGVVIYVGKAKDIRRRLSAYRNATRRKAHRKMRRLVREAGKLEVRPVSSEKKALALENQLIRTLEPRHNIQGAYWFLYPAIGVVRTPQRTMFCFTTRVDEFEPLGFRWYGVFRSRLRAKEAFDTLTDLLVLLGHRERVASLGAPRIRGSRVVGVRQLDARIVAATEQFLSGKPGQGLGAVSRALLDKPRARRDSREVQAQLRSLAAFHRTDLAPLSHALRQARRKGSFVSQEERDLLFIRVEGK